MADTHVAVLAVDSADLYRLAALLDMLNEQLESGIESCTIPGAEGVSPEFEPWVRRDRRMRRISEDFLMRIDELIRVDGALNP